MPSGQESGPRVATREGPSVPCVAQASGLRVAGATMPRVAQESRPLSVPCVARVLGPRVADAAVPSVAQESGPRVARSTTPREARAHTTDAGVPR
ncbi:hypothetical protein E2562_032632 [Oryza meyeriana var. granulata]|uniref:Uncharacterized protein n=1 Tax=Oryza meyeriana var. granulata TaxID=110450 RepID=A0A6G1D911_9ORYZ|nr:hypothetical protein E2562_032632 [Oryza meyeriana var. granulata]